MIEAVVLFLTLAVIVLLVLQFKKPKGDSRHIARAILIGLFVLAVVFINTFTVSRSRGLEWDLSFWVHVVLGSLFFASLLGAYVTGAMAKRAPAWKKWHGRSAYSTATFLGLSLLAAFVMPLLR